MQWDLALYDLVAPYLLRGAPLGPIHAAVSALYVQEYDIAVSAEGVVIRGVANPSGKVGGFFDPSTGTLGFNAQIDAQNIEGHPRDDSGRRDSWIDLLDTNIAFELLAPREASSIVAGGAAGLNPASDADTIALLTALDIDPTDAPPSDYPSTNFTLDMVITGAVLRPPFLKAASLLPDGRLVPVTGDDTVEITLPRFKLQLRQGSDVGNPLIIDMVSFGVGGLDEQADIAVADLIEMRPPYAFVGDSNTVGIGFRSAVLDLSTGSTPSEILDQFGFDESWTGLYLPEVRLFVAPNGLEDFAVSAGVRNFLIGWGAQGGITGDFELAVIDQGSGQLDVGARFVDPQGRAIGITRTGATTAEVALPPQTRMIVDIQGGRPPYSSAADLGDGSGASAGRVFDVDLGSATSRTITITVADGRTPPLQQTLTITAGQRTPQEIPGTTGPVQPAEIVSQATIRDGVAVLQPDLVIVGDDLARVSLALRPLATDTDWTQDGVGTVSTGTPTATFEIGPDTTIDLTATANPPPGMINDLLAYWHFAEPDVGRPDFVGYVAQPENSNTERAVDEPPESGWTGGGPVIPGHEDLLDDVPPGTDLTITGSASFENDSSANKQRYNYALARNRALAFQQLIETRFPGRFAFTIEPAPVLGPGDLPSAAWVADWIDNHSPRNVHWQSATSVPAITPSGTVTTAQLHRPPSVTPAVPELPDPPAAADPDPPDWFRSAAIKVRIVRDSFVALEVSGEVDFETAVEEQVRDGGVGANEVPSVSGLGTQNPADGIVAYKVLVQVDDAKQEWTVSASLGADPADIDGLLMTGALPGATPLDASFGRNMLGVTTAMAPVLATTAPPDPLNGDIGSLVLTGAAIGLPLTLAELGWITVERVILFGGEAVVKERSSGPEVSFLFDVETAISASITLGSFELLTIPRDTPLAIRYKAIGLRLGYTPPEDRFQFRPVFDSSKGYTIDVSGPGGIQVADPIGQVLQVLGARLARTNPLTFEIDLGFSVDLGVVSVDRARVRIPLSPAGAPELTALAASIDIPGAVRARGYLEIGTTGPPGAEISEMRGGLDLTLVPIKLRIKAEIAIAQIPAAAGGPATGVIVSIEVTFPAPIPLGNSGLGLMGLLGLFAMHYGRDETPFASDPTPALSWLQATGGEPTKLSEGSQHFWTPQIDRWAFGVGAVLGTMEGGTVFNLKGVFLLELPGPRILLMMKAALLTPPPAVKGVEEAGGSLLAVIDLDAGRGTLTIGIIASYEVKPLLKIRIPVEAFFNLKKSREWHIYLGKVDDPVQAKIISAFEGSGYLMLSGDGITGSGNLPTIPSGFAIATGLHVELIWGNKEIRIYASVAGGFDAVMGFQPFFLAGKLYLRGELRLVILSISAYAGLDLRIGTDPGTGQEVARLEGEICGKINLFFFSIKGCVDFAMGDEPLPPIPPLVEKLSLVSRGPALVSGSGADQPIDAVLAEAIESGSQPAAGAFADQDRVPIDTILAFTLTGAAKASAASVLGEAIGDSPGSTVDGWIDRGEQRIRYELRSVSLVSGALGAGNVPVVWWSPLPAAEPNPQVQLALLTWAPDPTPTAIERSEFLEEKIIDRWGTICDDPAPAAAVLFAFHREMLGPSEDGWTVEGTAWPDPPGTVRSEEADREIVVDESWWSGVSELDDWRGIFPAVIEGALVECGGCEPKPPGGPGGITIPGSVAVPGRVAGPRGDGEPGGLTVAVGGGPRDDALAVRAAIDAFTGERAVAPLVAEAVTPTDAIGRLRTATAISPSALLHATRGPSALDIGGIVAPPSGPEVCDARVLAAPMLDEGDVVTPLGDATREDEILAGWEEVGFGQSPLADAVRLHTAGIFDCKLLLASYRSLLEAEVLVVRVLDPDGNEMDRIVATSANQVPPEALPDRWTDPGGPWCEDVDRAIRFSPQFTDIDGWMTLVLLEIGEYPEAAMLEIGIDMPSGPSGGRGPVAVDDFTFLGDAAPAFAARAAQTGVRRLIRFYYLLCFELTRMQEAARHDYDEQIVEFEREELGRYLGLESGNYALLEHDSVYGVRIEWDQERESGGPVENEERTFWFRTETEPPPRFGQYLLLSLPNEREQHVFGEEPLRLVFSTPQVVNLYAEFGLELQVRLRASSFRQPDPDDLPVGEVYPFPISPDTLELLPAAVLNPFEETLEEVLDGTCIPIDEERVRHSARTINVPLDPLTDYVLDIETVPESDPENGPRTIVHSVPFSTGRFPTLDSFAVGMQTVRDEHRWVASGEMQAIATEFASRDPEGSELDTALIDAGLEPMPVPDRPRLVVFWEQPNDASDPDPVAILIDSPEPMRRFWNLPTKVTDDSVEPESERWESRPHEWLELAEGTATPGRIDGIVMAPGGQRALVVLSPGSRGERVQVEMVRRAYVDQLADPPGTTDQGFAVVDQLLNRAPWEE